ncbi:2,3-diaminopropionate biosynthesis protein SbnA [Desmospora profundinema]|uniref:Cysteine synthase A n=1 Tax=Desmospora profundinema TaxID=1571184 RepID=A0ABU1ILP1_9BACL|nr:2,3-diaminopropionate biosynthesis protein SbnA [Desmospora profundinema]MDR6225695.1 cysteine synthase A [Desmospora profundinema]
MIYSSILDCIGRTPLVYLNRLFSERDKEVIARLEFLNPGGSVKDRPAKYIVEKGLKTGTIGLGSHLIESTSGNLGIALAMVCRVYGLTFTSVVDPKISKTNLKILKALGANIDMVEERDDQGGYLKTRIRRVHELMETIPNSVWIRQYANELNWKAHYIGADELIHKLDGPIDFLFAAVSTTGTIHGVGRRMKNQFPHLKIVAVDAVGSVIFGHPPKNRELPGIGATRVPELCCPEEIDEVIHISDYESAKGCRELVEKEGIFAGGSSGAVISAIQKKLPTLPNGSRVLTLLPDRGDRYLDLVYSDEWMMKFLEEVK